LAISIEEHRGEEPWVLRPSGRYAHSPAHVHALATRAGLTKQIEDRSALRREDGDWVDGVVFVFVR
ncbi:MAG: SAM-dependent methyltransferase, partial [Myxococcota bacterium]